MANRNAQQNTNVGYYDSAVVTPRSRQVRPLNNDYEYLKDQELPTNASNDAIFNASYKNKGLQPQGIGRVRKNKVVANDDSYIDNGEEQATRRVSTNIAKQLLIKKTSTTAKQAVLRARVSTVNASIMAWGTTIWFGFQLPFAVISLIMLGIMGFVSGAIASSGVVGTGAAWLAGMLAKGLSLILGLDVNLAAMADGLFFICYMMVMAAGLITLMGAYLQYTLSFFKPLGGEQAGLKMGLFLLALIGYSIPLLNLFPWALVFMAGVWKYPR